MSVVVVVLFYVVMFYVVVWMIVGFVLSELSMCCRCGVMLVGV